MGLFPTQNTENPFSVIMVGIRTISREDITATTNPCDCIDSHKLLDTSSSSSPSSIKHGAKTMARSPGKESIVNDELYTSEGSSV